MACGRGRDGRRSSRKKPSRLGHGIVQAPAPGLYKPAKFVDPRFIRTTRWQRRIRTMKERMRATPVGLVSLQGVKCLSRGRSCAESEGSLVREWSRVGGDLAVRVQTCYYLTVHSPSGGSFTIWARGVEA